MIDENIMYSEVYEILSILGPKYIDKIPPQLYEYIENKRKKDYSCNINNYETIENQNLMNETVEFISYINLNYWVSEKERKSLISIYNENEEIFNEKSRKKYNPNNILKNGNQIPKTEVNAFSPQIAMVEYRKSIFKNIIHKIKSLFQKS